MKHFEFHITYLEQLGTVDMSMSSTQSTRTLQGAVRNGLLSGQSREFRGWYPAWTLTHRGIVGA
jgi:hypothetical protein